MMTDVYAESSAVLRWLLGASKRGGAWLGGRSNVIAADTFARTATTHRNGAGHASEPIRTLTFVLAARQDAGRIHSGGPMGREDGAQQGRQGQE